MKPIVRSRKPVLRKQAAASNNLPLIAVACVILAVIVAILVNSKQTPPPQKVEVARVKPIEPEISRKTETSDPQPARPVQTSELDESEQRRLLLQKRTELDKQEHVDYVRPKTIESTEAKPVEVTKPVASRDECAKYIQYAMDHFEMARRQRNAGDSFLGDQSYKAGQECLDWIRQRNPDYLREFADKVAAIDASPSANAQIIPAKPDALTPGAKEAVAVHNEELRQQWIEAMTTRGNHAIPAYIPTPDDQSYVDQINRAKARRREDMHGTPIIPGRE